MADEFPPEEVKNTFCVKVRLTLPIECTLRLTLPYRVHAASDAPLSSARCVWRSLIECTLRLTHPIECTLRLTHPYRVHAASDAPLSSARCV
ncbi:MEIOTIC F-BOX protein MOF [Dissostichus eleginoides]|uniref:MEIOTIC F-BOX protein MOF n=1 Tax=Dissostichus eleginoides TaxID=100907 RepID=A0AAD9BJC5_DISEL|nr:MEIOTIC F-BOX protein MOF [Dissostichus eleginoides]